MTNFKFFTKVAWRVAALSAFALVGVQIYLGVSGGPETEEISVSIINKARAQNTGASRSGAPDPKVGASIDDIWKPAATPPGGTSWALLEAAKEVTRTDENGFTISYPLFTKQQRDLEGKRIKVSGWMDPLQVGSQQKRFVLLGYPPGCPFHFHAAPMQFIEVMASTPFKTDRTNVITVSGVLELTGYDESGVFYRLWDARPA
ncbi:hypothetical protein EH31_07935 [Erythrobacter longus]|uniref:DUF3299 domain-containing protein n=1 Tax=Erythrobacter longus TaxID=1044 RepID=A0A074MDU8_ERYLO|nr:DUF3299 domain-containing protein [Erythrobacter longus]KEO90955.1 hypothetical protein EH31_07935 [Erythrobacter longus]